MHGYYMNNNNNHHPFHAPPHHGGHAEGDFGGFGGGRHHHHRGGGGGFGPEGLAHGKGKGGFRDGGLGKGKGGLGKGKGGFGCGKGKGLRSIHPRAAVRIERLGMRGERVAAKLQSLSTDDPAKKLRLKLRAQRIKNKVLSIRNKVLQSKLRHDGSALPPPPPRGLGGGMAHFMTPRHIMMGKGFGKGFGKGLGRGKGFGMRGKGHQDNLNMKALKEALVKELPAEQVSILVDGRALFHGKLTLADLETRLAGRKYTVFCAPHMLDALETGRQLPSPERLHVCEPRQGVAAAILKKVEAAEAGSPAVVLTGNRRFAPTVVAAGAKPMLLRHFKASGVSSSEDERGELSVASVVDNEPYLGEAAGDDDQDNDVVLVASHVKGLGIDGCDGDDSDDDDSDDDDSDDEDED